MQYWPFVTSVNMQIMSSPTCLYLPHFDQRT
ncbi:hypothetical protein T4A_4776 [Trichinella pseudospiralis]|uniref:Uncharacterized protein n=1 Tax=Trichinella pseudospiralis TaxID=6337 RepID=A0A0V1CQD3_TRIPS|nr:hypothetical protein T4A_4776 [Trichinella pseudospiralis]